MKGRYVIAVGVDGTEAGRRALHWAAREAADRDAYLEAVVAWRRDAPNAGLGRAAEADRSARPKQRAERVLARATATLPVKVPVAGRIVEGRAEDALAAAARNADLLVLGSRGRDEPGRRAPGAVAEQVASRASCPVVVIAASAEPPPPPVRIIGPQRRRRAAATVADAPGAEPAPLPRGAR